MLIGMAAADRYNLWLGFIEQFAIVGKSGGSFHPLDGRSSARLVGIGHADDFALGELLPDRIQPVAIVSPPRMADHRDTKFFRHGEVPRNRRRNPAITIGAGAPGHNLPNETVPPPATRRCRARRVWRAVGCGEFHEPHQPHQVIYSLIDGGPRRTPHHPTWRGKRRSTKRLG